MPDGTFSNLPEIIRITNVSRMINESIATTANPLLLAQQTNRSISTANADISPAASFGFVILILATVVGNTLVLLALFLDKRLHSPSFYLIANMAIADLLLGLSVLPFSSVLELLNDRWIFGEGFCSAWLALDVLCCTASIMALMAVSIDRYLGVTRPLNYSTIMTTQRTIYLVIVVWAVSILTSVVPLFGLTDRERKPNDSSTTQSRFETCKVNKNTFYTIFSSMISFYIPVIILLILYSRVYQEAKKQGQKLENEKRRLYQIDYQIATEQVRRKQTPANGHSTDKQPLDQRSPSQTPKTKRAYSSIPDGNRSEITTALLHARTTPDEDNSLDRTLTLNDDNQLKKEYSNPKHNNPDDDTSHSNSSLTHHMTTVRRSIGKRISSTIKRNSQTYLPHLSNYQHHHSGQMFPTDELLIIKRKLHNLRREKKAFRTLGLILSALLICWLPFFVTLPVMSILKHHRMITDENMENTWFKITFWLGYCNSALNPFVYAFSNRAIRRAFRQVLFRRFCCCGLRCWLCRHFCPKKYSEQQSCEYRRGQSTSFATQTSQVAPRRTSSLSAELIQTAPRATRSFDAASSSLLPSVRTSGATGSGGPVVSFADFLTETGGDEKSASNNDKRTDEDAIEKTLS